MTNLILDANDQADAAMREARAERRDFTAVTISADRVLVHTLFGTLSSTVAK